MIQYVTGNLLESKAQALVNTVNTVGVMGKGVALQFKNNYPNNFKNYVIICKKNLLQIGSLLVFEEENLITGKKIIINFPTKTDWRKPSEYEYIEKGLIELKKIVSEKGLKSIAIPPLGVGNGGLNWNRVKEMIENYLTDLNCHIFVFEPNYAVNEVLKKEKVKLTPARAMLLAVLYDLVKQGEFVTEFAGEKICYFLQRFGAKQYFNLEYKPYFYGPYSGKVKHVLYYLNGSYIKGFSSKDKKPFEELDLLMECEPEVLSYLKENNQLEIVKKTKKFLAGFYSSFGLELLSTIDFISQEKQTSNLNEMKQHLENWSNRKKTMFSNDKFVEKSITKLKQAELIK